MSAIITDQLRILNAKNFVNSFSDTKSYYTFIGLTNPTDISSEWETNPPSPIDNFDNENNYWDTIVGMKKIGQSDVRQVVPKRFWSSGTTYDMYRHDYSILNPGNVSGTPSLYTSSFYVINSDYRVYVCLYNGTDPDNPDGRPSLDEPTFVDLEPRPAGTSGDGYLWKYLYTIKPAEAVKFETSQFIPVPQNWETNQDNTAVRENALDGSIKVILIEDRGENVGEANRIYTKVPIKGDGTGGECTITINNDRKVESIIVSNGGFGYTYGSVDLDAGGVPSGPDRPAFKVIIPPKGGHGADIYRELGAYSVLLYSRIENDNENPDFITGNQIARVGIIENPQFFGTNEYLTLDKASSLNALKLTGIGYSSAVFVPDSYITQTVSTGVTAVGRVVSYDKNTGVLKYWQDRSIAGFSTNGEQQPNPQYGFELIEFTSSPDLQNEGSLFVLGGSIELQIDSAFSGQQITINNRTFKLGQSFENGLSNPEVKKYSGNMIYVDNRPSITRSPNQKEDIKVILQF